MLYSTYDFSKYDFIFVFVAVVLGSTTSNHKSSTFSKGYIIIDSHCSPVSRVVVMATRTCQPLLRHSRSSQLAAVARCRYPRTG